MTRLILALTLAAPVAFGADATVRTTSDPTASIRMPIDENVGPAASTYGYCFQMGFSCGLKGMPPVWSCSNDNGYGWYGNCN